MEIHYCEFVIGTCDTSDVSDIKVTVTESQRRWAEMNPVDISWGLLELVIDRCIFASCVQFYRVDPEISMIKMVSRGQETEVMAQ